MDLFSELVTIALTGIMITIIFVFLGDQIAYYIRSHFTFPPINLGWDPTAGLPYSWRNRRNPDLNASDWASRALDD